MAAYETSTVGGARALSVKVAMSNVLATLGEIPPVAWRALAERNFDTLSYHRSSVLKHHGLPGGRDAQKMLAANLKRQVKNLTAPQSAADTVGQGYAVPLRSQGKWGDFLANLETGKEINSRTPMLIAFSGSSVIQRFIADKAHNFITPSGFLVREITGGNSRTILLGKFARRRKQRALLGYYRQWDSVVAKAGPRYDRDMDLVLNEAGRDKLEKTFELAGVQRAAFSAEMRRYLTENPGRRSDASRSAARVARAVRAAALARIEGRAS